MPPEKTLVWRYTARFMVVVHSEYPPSDAEGTALMEEWEARPELARSLVYSEGGAPSLRDRARITNLLRERGGAVAVVSESPFARAAGRALNVFRPEIRVFRPNDLESAFDYLGATAGERKEMLRVLDELRAELGLRKP
jgi:hypothetical protein